jgi:hypothetical protein
MKMKYFRILFGVSGRYFAHMGELKDTGTSESFTFLYLRDLKRQANQIEETGRRLFLYPECIDLLVLGQRGMAKDGELKEMLGKVRIRTLVTAGGCDEIEAQKVIDLEKQKNQVYRLEAVGWSIFAKCCEDGSVLLAHGFDRSTSPLYEDCVMSVKETNGSERCIREEHPDGYGCALGCTLHQDYDVCRYRGSGSDDYLISALLLPQVPDETLQAELEKELKKKPGEFRFFVMQETNGTSVQPKGRLYQTDPGFRQYFVGVDGEMGYETIAGISGRNRRVVILGDGEGLCCSGFLKNR